MMRDIYINCNLNQLTKFSNSSKSIKFENIFPWNISQTIMRTVPNTTRIVMNCVMEGVSPFEFERKSRETETKTCLEFPNGGKATVEQILASEETNKSKIARL